MAYKSLVTFGTAAESGINGALTSFSFNHTSEAGQNQVAYVAVAARDATASGDTAVSNITYGGVAMTPIANAVTGGGGASAVRVSTFLLMDPTPGVNSVSITFAAAVPQSAAMAITFNNIDQTTPQDITAGTDSGNAALTEIDGTVTIERACVISASVLNGGGGVNINRPIAFPSANPGFATTTLSNQDDGSLIELFVFFGQSDIIPNLITIVQLQFPGGAAKFGHVTTYFRPLRRRSHGT